MAGPLAESAPSRCELLSCRETSSPSLWALPASANWEEAAQRNITRSLSFVELLQSKFAGLQQRVSGDLIYLQGGLCTHTPSWMLGLSQGNQFTSANGGFLLSLVYSQGVTVLHLSLGHMSEEF